MNSLEKIWNTISEIWSENGGATQILVYIVFIFTVMLLLLAWTTNTSIITSFFSIMVDLHAFNDETKIYLETLFCVLAITMVQFYQYHISTVGLYDKLSPRNIDLKNKLLHSTLQFFMAAASFCAGLVLCKFLFITLFSFDILDKFEVNIASVTDYYLPFLDLKWLILYFVTMDVVLLALTNNFLNDPGCSSATESELITCKDSFSSSLFIGVPALILILIISFASKNMENDYLLYSNINPYSIFDYLSFLIIYTLQIGYLISGFREKYKMVNSGSM